MNMNKKKKHINEPNTFKKIKTNFAINYYYVTRDGFKCCILNERNYLCQSS